MDLLTQPETAKETRLSERNLERRRLAGTGPKFVKLGRRVFYRRAELEAWIAERTCRSTSEADGKLECHSSPAPDVRVPSEDIAECASQYPPPRFAASDGSHRAQPERGSKNSAKNAEPGTKS